MEKLIRNKGITMVALVVTIIILLILAGISVATLTGENGLIKKAQQAKEESEIATEKEILDQAIIQAMGQNRQGNLTQDNLQNALEELTKEGATEVSKIRKKQ